MTSPVTIFYAIAPKSVNKGIGLHDGVVVLIIGRYVNFSDGSPSFFYSRSTKSEQAFIHTLILAIRWIVPVVTASCLAINTSVCCEEIECISGIHLHVMKLKQRK